MREILGESVRLSLRQENIRWKSQGPASTDLEKTLRNKSEYLNN